MLGSLLVVFVVCCFSRLRVFWHFREGSVSVPCDRLSERRCGFCWQWQFFLDSERATSVSCVLVRMSVRGFFIVWILLLLASEVTMRTRKSRGFLVPVRLTRGRSIDSLYIRRCWTPIEFLVQPSHCTWLDCSTLDLFYWALLAPRDCSGHLFIEQEAIKRRRRRSIY